MTTETSQHSTALEPWTPPAPPSTQRSAFGRILIALRPAALPIVVGAISWIVSVHGGAHSKGDTVVPILITAAGASIGTIQTIAAARRAAQRPTGIGETEPHTALIAVRAGLVAWAVAGLSGLAALDVYTTNPWMRALYTVIAAVAPIAYRRLAEQHHDDLHLAASQKLALERTVAESQIRLEQTKQNGETSRTANVQEHTTLRTRLEQDGETERTAITQQHKTARAVVNGYVQLTRPESAVRTRAAVPAAAPQGLPEHLLGLLGLSPEAAKAIGADGVALLGLGAGAPAAEEDGQSTETPGHYL